MVSILKEATLAKEQGNWSLVNYHLKQLASAKDKKLTHLDDQQLEKATELAFQVLLESDFQQRWEVAKVFPKLGEGVIAPLLQLLEDKTLEVDVYWYIVTILGHFDTPQVVLALVKILENAEEEDLAAAAAKSLARIGKSALISLEELLARPETRLLAVRSLAYIRSPEIIEPLLKVSDDPSTEVRANALEALSSFHDPRVPPVLVNALGDFASPVRKEAISGLKVRIRQLNEEYDLVTHLQPLLYDLSFSVAQQAILSLGRLGNEEACAALFNLFLNANTPLSLKKEAIRALSWVETELALSYLRQALNTADPELSLEIVTVLGRQSKSSLQAQATQILSNFFDTGRSVTEVSSIKQALATSLGQTGDKSAVNILLVLSQDEEQSVRLHAIAALKKLSHEVI